MAPESEKNEATIELIEYRVTQMEKKVSWIMGGIIALVILVVTLLVNVILMRWGLPTV